jgi:hypothetical protein
VFFGVSVFVIWRSEELLKALHGKLLIAFVVSSAVYYTAAALFKTSRFIMVDEIDEICLMGGVWFSLILTNIMNFDVWWVLERFNSPDPDDSKRLKYYSIGATFAFVFLTFMLFERLMGSYGNFLNVVVFINGVFMALSGYQIYKLSKDHEVNETENFRNVGRR